MDKLQLITGNRNYSPHSLRPWLLLQEFEVEFEETRIRLFQSDSTEKIALFSPSLKVPVLIHDDIKVWDSLAICEYLSEAFLEDRGWPVSARKKAAARAVANELHADFQHFKTEWPMNCQYSRTLKPDLKLEQEIGRLDAIIYCCRHKYGSGGDYLFGTFSIADCMMAPFAISLQSYGATVSEKAQGYLTQLLDNPHLQWWMDEASNENEVLEWEQRA